MNIETGWATPKYVKSTRGVQVRVVRSALALIAEFKDKPLMHNMGYSCTALMIASQGVGISPDSLQDITDAYEDFFRPTLEEILDDRFFLDSPDTDDDDDDWINEIFDQYGWFGKCTIPAYQERRETALALFADMIEAGDIVI